MILDRRQLSSRSVPALIVLLLAGFGLAPALEAASRRPVRALKGLVVSSNALASEAGVEILEAGGNAVDAAVAVGFALAVVHPGAGNLGGGGFMVVHDATAGTEFTVDYREMAPASAHREMYLDERGQVIEGLSTRGYLASGVPGSVAGMQLAWERAGRLPWEELLEPAIRLAGEGFPLSYTQSEDFKDRAELLGLFSESRRIFLRDGDYYQEGEVFRQPELARTLRLIQRQGTDAFYRGEIARLIAEDMAANGGNITAADLKRYEAKLREPIRGNYRGYEVVSMGPPSSGGVVLVEMLNMIEPFPVGNLGPGSSAEIHLKSEVMTRAFADRAAFLGDPDHTELPVAGLISKDYARRWSRQIRRDWASPSSVISHGDPVAFESEDTTHYSVVDAAGNGVAATTTINGWFGSGVTIRGAGFLMNNEMDDFTSKPGAPNLYGLIQGEANSIAPGRRPLSAMTPTLVKKDGKLLMLLGSPGGPAIINTVFQIILNVLDHGLDIQQAVDAPRVHHQWLPDRLLAEQHGLSRDVEQALQERGHRIAYRGSMGRAHCILIDEEGVRWGAADPRAPDARASIQ